MTPGFNLVGYATSPTGLGEDLRSFAQMLDFLDIPFSVIDIPTDVQGRVPVSWKSMTTQDYGTTFFFMAAVECQNLARYQPQLFSVPQKKIGYFLWELPDFPEDQVPALQLVDHIWCPSRFVQKTIFDKTRQLTLALPLPVLQSAESGRDFRAELGIPNKAFVALYMFDMRSTLKRKNPEGVVSVFEQFLKTHSTAHLILKISRWEQSGTKALSWIPKHPKFHVIKETLGQGDISALYAQANCYLSLHASEGFGRTLVEAMHHGLYLVCTNFSGPGDFLNAENALLVDWEREEVTQKDYPNLTSKSWWGKPVEKSALKQLKVAFKLSKTGRNTQGIKDSKKFSYETLATKYLPILKTYFAN